jgi:hypothetical protein
MEYLTVEYWGEWSRDTRTLKVDDDGYGVLDKAASMAFRRGQCHALALAIHELTGWPIKGLGDYDRPNSPAHCVVWCPKLRGYVDVRGRVSRKYFYRRNGWKVINRRVRPVEIESFEDYLKPNMEAARAFAKTVLRNLKIEFSTGTLKK